MIEIHTAREWEIEAAKSLWTDTFGDEAAFQDNFYRLCCALEGPLVLTDGSDQFLAFLGISWLADESLISALDI